MTTLIKNKTAEVSSEVSIDSAIQLIRPKLPAIKKILKELNFSGTLTKSTYGKDWLIENPAEGITGHRFIFRSSGPLLYPDLLKSLKVRYEISGLLILPLGSSESSLSGNKISDVQMSFHLNLNDSQ